MINFAKYRAVYFLFSLVVIAGGLAALYLGPGLRFSIEFSSGSAVNASFVDVTPQEDVEAAINALGYESAVVQGLGDREYFLRLPEAEEPESQQAVVRAALEEYAGALNGYSFDLVSPAVARETVRNGLIAVLIAVLGILGYIVYAFRGVRHPVRYGIAAIIALMHDIAAAFAVAGIFMLIGSQWLHLEISSMFLVGVLTLLGYSINDTIVIFDRIRENFLRDVNRDHRRDNELQHHGEHGALDQHEFHDACGSPGPVPVGADDDTRFPVCHGHRSRLRNLQLRVYCNAGHRIVGNAQPGKAPVCWRRARRDGGSHAGPGARLIGTPAL